MKKQILLLPVLFAFSLPAFSQELSTVWFEKNDRGNRYEGTYSKQVANPAVELVSFTYGVIEDYDFGEGQLLRAKFYLPEKQPYWIKAEELLPVQYYWMEGKETAGAKGWNQFENWPVDGWPKRLGITARRLGVIVKVGDKKSSRVAPVTVFHTDPSARIDAYAAKLRLGYSISEGKVEVYRGLYEKKIPPEHKKVQVLKLRDKSGGTSFPLVIDRSSLTPGSGWYTVALELSKLGSAHKIPFTFSFYHWEE